MGDHVTAAEALLYYTYLLNYINYMKQSFQCIDHNLQSKDVTSIYIALCLNKGKKISIKLTQIERDANRI